MKNRTTLFWALALASASTSCLQLPPLAAGGCSHEPCTHASLPPEPDPWARTAEEPTVLYARDGSPVSDVDAVNSAPARPGEPGSTSSPTAPNARDVEREDGRLYLLELYQNAVDERDSLMAEVARQESEILDLRSMQASLETEFGEMQARLQALEADKMAAEEQSFELANRLTTAQIGRLQAELRVLRGQALEGRVDTATGSTPIDEADLDARLSSPHGLDAQELDAQGATPDRFDDSGFGGLESAAQPPAAAGAAGTTATERPASAQGGDTGGTVPDTRSSPRTPPDTPAGTGESLEGGSD